MSYTLSGYLVLTELDRGYKQLTARFVKKRPATLHRWERLVELNVNLPDSLFAPPPVIRVDGTLEPPITPDLIRAHIQEAGYPVVFIEERSE